MLNNFREFINNGFEFPQENIFDKILSKGLLSATALSIIAAYATMSISADKFGGKNIYFFVSLLIYSVFVIWQIDGLMSFMKKPRTDAYKRLIYWICVYTFFSIFIVLSLALIIHFFTDSNWIENCYSAINNGAEMPHYDSFLKLLLVIIILALMLTGMSGGFAMILMLGRLGLGLTLSTALNQFMNGGSFDMTAFFDIVINFASEGMNDFVALFMGLVWTFISSTVLKSPSIQ